MYILHSPLQRSYLKGSFTGNVTHLSTTQNLINLYLDTPKCVKKLNKMFNTRQKIV